MRVFYICCGNVLCTCMRNTFVMGELEICWGRGGGGGGGGGVEEFSTLMSLCTIQ